MTPQTFIFIGRSGAGKGTQAKMIQEYLKKINPQREVLAIQTGAEFRAFIQGDSLTQKLSREIYEKAAFQPEFLAVYMWTNVLVNKYTADEHLVMDGLPRQYHEAGVLDSVFSFYKLEKPHVIYLDVSKEEAANRMLARKRVDDVPEEIEARLKWFEVQVFPTLDFYKDNPNYDYHVIAGERPPEEVHADIVAKTKLP